MIIEVITIVRVTAVTVVGTIIDEFRGGEAQGNYILIMLM